MFRNEVAPINLVFAQDDVTNSGQTSTTTWANVFASWTFVSPGTQTLMLHVDVSCYATTGGQVQYRVLVDGSAAVGGQPLNAQKFFFNNTFEHLRISFRIPIAFTPGSHTIQLQWQG